MNEPENNSQQDRRAGKYLTFCLGNEEYGVPLVRVREIIALMAITPVPLTPTYVRGVMNLRGKVIPVIDLRNRFSMGPTEDHERKCIIVLDVCRDDTPVQMSILVDAVSEVLHIASDEIEDAPMLNTGLDTGYIHGVAKTKGSVKILLEVDAILGFVPQLEQTTTDSTNSQVSAGA